MPFAYKIYDPTPLMDFSKSKTHMPFAYKIYDPTPSTFYYLHRSPMGRCVKQKTICGYIFR
jgi:hypothetical protein